MINGSIVALITPMNSDGTIDYASLERLVEFHIEQGTDAIVAVGTTGESATLPMKEHAAVVAQTVKFASGRIPVIGGNGANATAEAVIELLRPVQEKYYTLADDPAETSRLIAKGAEKAREIASTTLSRARDNIGLLKQ